MTNRNKARGYEHERGIVLWAQSLGFDWRKSDRK